MSVKKIGIIGGMGPRATISFYAKIIEIFQRRFNARYDSDYPEMVIYNLPIPDVVEKVENKEITKDMLCSAARNLELLGVEFIAIPCNTAHIFYDLLKKSVSIPVLNLIGETAKKVKLYGFRKAGLLATEITYSHKLYERWCERYGMKIITPDVNGRKEITEVIMNIMSGKERKRSREVARRVMETLIRSGAECIILGCTELPLIIRKKDVDVELFDTLHILAESTVKFCMGVVESARK